MKRVLLLLCFVVAINAATHTAKWGCLQSWNCFGFWEYLPNSYNASSTTKHPTIVFLHGLGEYGNGTAPDINKLLGTAIPNYINTNRWPAAWDFVVISPQDFNGWWNADRVTRVLDYLAINYPKVDSTRIYLTGLSAGGGGVWDFAGKTTAHANRVAAIVPICGSAQWTPAAVSTMVASCIPVWAFHNTIDPTVSPANTDNWITQLNAAGINPVAKKTIYPVSGHDSWTATYDPATTNPNNIYSWFLSYSTPRTACAAAPSPSPSPTPSPSPSAAPSPSPSPAPCPAAVIGTGKGLRGVYYRGFNFTEAVGARVDATINFNYATGTGTGIPTLESTNYSVRWTGTVLAKFTGSHTFYTTSDDGVKLTVNGASVINNWTDHGATENSGTISLVAGTSYSVVLEFYQKTSSSVTTLSWASGSCLAKEIIPTSQLTPGALNICP